MSTNPHNKKAGISYDNERKKFVLWFDFDVTKTELLNGWNLFNEVRKKVTGRAHYKSEKLPDDLVFLYGVHFLRKHHATFKQIHDAYMNNDMPYFGGEYHFLTEFDLQKYYDRNKKYLKTKN